MRFRGDVEGLRAVAVLAVLGYHAGLPGFSGGFVGVDVFFVVSGFLITSLLMVEREQTGRVDLAAFMVRRVRRILPLATLVLTATAIGSVIWLPSTRFGDLGLEVVASAAFVANLLFAARGTDYLAADIAASPLQHFWSLAVEEQFYLLWPALVLLVGLGSTRWRRRVALLTVAVILLSFTIGILSTSRSPSWAYFATPSRAWELAAGALLAVWGRSAELPVRVRAGVAWLGLFGVVAVVITFGRVTAFPGWAAAVPVLATLAVLLGADERRLGPARVLALPLPKWIGARSFGLYLWHWPVLVIAETVHGRPLGVVAITGAVLVTVVLTEASYRLVESPARHATIFAGRRLVALGLGAAMVMFAVGAGWTMTRLVPRIDTGVLAAAPADPVRVVSSVPTLSTLLPTTVPSTTSSHSVISPPEVTMPPPFDTASDATPLAIVDALNLDTAPENLRPRLGDARNDVGALYGNGCHVYFSVTVPDHCVLGDQSGEVTVALWGDSHAAQWFPALDIIAQQRGWRLLAVTQGGCPVIDVKVWNRTANADATFCPAWRAAVRDRLIAENVKVVMIAQYWGLLDSATRAAISADSWRAEFPALLEDLRLNGLVPVVLLDTPDPPEDVPGCLVKNPQRISVCAPGRPGRTEAAVAAAMGEIARAAGVSVVDPRPWLCAAGGCPVVVGDLLIYRDSHHLSAHAARWLVPLLDDVLGRYVEAIAAATPK